MLKKVERSPARRAWARPEVKRLSAGSAEANQPSGINDGGPVGNARS